MKATELIAIGLESGGMWLESLLADLEGEDLVTPPTTNGGNHALWVIGHITVSEASVLKGYIQGSTSPALPEWQSLFGKGSQPVSDASNYPSKKELLSKYREVRKETLQLLRSLNDADLDKPTTAEYKELFGTVGKCFAIMIGHQTFHAGQVSDVRRALGRKTIFG